MATASKTIPMPPSQWVSARQNRMPWLRPSMSVRMEAPGGGETRNGFECRVGEGGDLAAQPEGQGPQQADEEPAEGHHGEPFPDTELRGIAQEQKGTAAHHGSDGCRDEEPDPVALAIETATRAGTTRQPAVTSIRNPRTLTTERMFTTFAAGEEFLDRVHRAGQGKDHNLVIGADQGVAPGGDHAAMLDDRSDDGMGRELQFHQLVAQPRTFFAHPQLQDFRSGVAQVFRAR